MARLHSDRRGAVYVEFLVIFVILLTWILSLIQAALLRHGHLAVQRAANAAARSAVVVLDDDPKYYGGEPRNTIEGGGTSGDGVDAFLSWAGIAGGVGGSNGRLATIRTAAGYPLMSLAPPIAAGEGSKSVADALGGPLGYAPAGVAALYNGAALAVVLPTGYKSQATRTRVAHDGPVLVRVSYAFHCGVPLARAWMCRDLASLREDDYASDFAGLSSGGLDALGPFDGGRFVLLKAESELPNQGATYGY